MQPLRALFAGLAVSWAGAWIAPAVASEAASGPDVARPPGSVSPLVSPNPQAMPSGDAEPGAQRYRMEIAAPEDLQAPIRERTLLGRWRLRADYDPD